MSSDFPRLEPFPDRRACRIRLAGEDAVTPLGPDVVAELRRLFDVCARDAVEIVVLSGSTRAFCAGLDLRAVSELADKHLRTYVSDVAALLRLMRAMPFLTIAELTGPAVGAGADLALACDLQLAHPTVSLRFPGPQFGLVMGIERAVQVLGSALAFRSYLGGMTVSIDDMRRVGAVSVSADGAALDREVEELVQRMLSVPAGSVRAVIAAAKGQDASITAASIAAPEFPDRVRKFAAAALART